MTQSLPLLDPPSNGKCLDPKEAAYEELCQREACLGWGGRRRFRRHLSLVAASYRASLDKDSNIIVGAVGTDKATMCGGAP